MTELANYNPIDMLVRNIGVYGPFVLFVMAISQLYSRPKYLFWFCVLISLNEMINRVLKLTLREPRPKRITDHDWQVGQQGSPSSYGMPSWHIQHAMFITIYMLFVQPSWVSFCISMVIVVIVFYERYADKYHTIRQLLVGAVIGSAIAYIGAIGVSKYMEYRSSIVA
jgi:membrane-associated phospholipid phosphatase